MAKSNKALCDELRAEWKKKIFDFIEGLGEEVFEVGTNEIAFPTTDSDRNERSIVITIKVPTGANKGTEPYDVYEMAEDFQLKQKAKEEARVKREQEKKKKIARDTEYRKKQAEAKEKREKGEQSPFFFQLDVLHLTKIIDKILIIG